MLQISIWYARYGDLVSFYCDVIFNKPVYSIITLVLEQKGTSNIRRLPVMVDKIYTSSNSEYRSPFRDYREFGLL